MHGEMLIKQNTIFIIKYFYKIAENEKKKKKEIQNNSFIIPDEENDSHINKFHFLFLFKKNRLKINEC